ncbi:MFS transporter [Caulobacter sp. UC70_42]|uniref:MFS transporter n=1 Tax=Caulobacter sp. UC70_42 TaxID=3374551 RepID=UPI003757446C
MPPITADASVIRTRHGALSVTLLAISAFVIVTTEFLIVGLLPALARDLGVSIPTAGMLVTLFAFAVMLFGPILTGLVSHFDRKRLFIVLLAVFAGSNALAAAAPNILVLAVARFLPALALPIFWGTASETAAEIAGPDKASKAVANVYMGIAGAMVFGIPLGTLGGRCARLARRILGFGGAFGADGGSPRVGHARFGPPQAPGFGAPAEDPRLAPVSGQHRSVGSGVHCDVHRLHLSGGYLGDGR